MLQTLYKLLFERNNNSITGIPHFALDDDRVIHILQSPLSNLTRCNRTINPHKVRPNDQSTCITCLNTLPNEVLLMYTQLMENE